MRYIKKITFLKVLFFFTVTLFFLFKLPTPVDAVCFFDDSDCAPDETCVGVVCVKQLPCEVGFCRLGGYDWCISGFHYDTHACVQDFVCDDSNVIPANFGAFPGSINEACSFSCGAQCKINTDCPVPGSTCSGCLCITPTPTPTNTPTPTPTPFPCTDQRPIGGLLNGCFTTSFFPPEGCPADWVKSIQNPNTTCQATETCCYFNPPATPNL